MYIPDPGSACTTSPTADLEVTGTDGALFTGTFGSGSIPAESSGTRLMWYPGKASFRAGEVTGSQWDDEFTGEHSFASGYNTWATGDHSSALGYATKASGLYSTALGDRTEASGQASTAIGVLTEAFGDYSVAMGWHGEAHHHTTFVWADGSDAAHFTSTANDQFLIRAAGGVGIGKNNPATQLDVNGVITATGGN